MTMQKIPTGSKGFLILISGHIEQIFVCNGNNENLINIHSDNSKDILACQKLEITVNFIEEIPSDVKILKIN